MVTWKTENNLGEDTDPSGELSLIYYVLNCSPIFTVCACVDVLIVFIEFSLYCACMFTHSSLYKVLMNDFRSHLGKLEEINILPLLSLRIQTKHNKHMKTLKAVKKRYLTISVRLFSFFLFDKLLNQTQFLGNTNTIYLRAFSPLLLGVLSWCCAFSCSHGMIPFQSGHGNSVAFSAYWSWIIVHCLQV